MIKKILILSFAIWSATISLVCQGQKIDTTIYTPRSITISAKYFIGDDYTP